MVLNLMSFPTIIALEQFVPELAKLANCKKSDINKLQNFSILMQTAARLWVIQRSLYDPNCDFFIDLEVEWFDCATWIKKFWQKIPNANFKSLEYFLLGEHTTFYQDQWKKSVVERHQVSYEILTEILSSQIFQVTHRTIRNNFQQLSKLEQPRLIKSASCRGKYQKVKADFGNLINSSEPTISGNYLLSETENWNFLNDDVSAIAQLLLNKINGTQRLFIQTEYVAKEDLQDLAADWADNLKELWKQNVVSPIQIKYRSASKNEIVTCIIYPISIYYYQRAYYLYAFGTTPYSQDLTVSGQWYNYRLERILDLKILSWESSSITKLLKSQIYQQDNLNYLYTPDYIKEQLELAYGFNFYRESKTMLLRFNHDYYRRYIQDTIRHATFTRLKNITEVKNFIIEQLALKKDKTLNRQQSKLLTIIERFPDDAYYKVRYRVGDNNVIMRLRSWGFNVEVILPGDLRQKMREDIQQTNQLYTH